jgi:hypothetical protein
MSRQIVKSGTQSALTAQSILCIDGGSETHPKLEIFCRLGIANDG